MPKNASTALLILLLLSSCSTLLSVNATSPETLFVPDDYGSIAEAISHAAIGDTIYVKSGTYNEFSLSINKLISIIGENTDSTIINLDSPSHEGVMSLIFHYVWYDPALVVNCSGFRLSGFTITTTGGIISINGNETKLTDNSITAHISVTGSHNQVCNNSFYPQVSLNGVSVTGSFCNVSSNQVVGALYVGGEHCLLSSNNVRGNVGISANNSLIENNHFHDSSDFFTVSGNNNIVSDNTVDRYAIGLRVSGSNNTFLLNDITRCGMAVSPGTGNKYYANYFSGNAWILSNFEAMTTGEGNKSVLVHNNFEDNHNYNLKHPITSTEQCVFDDGKEGNYWSDYRGTDANSDGVGDEPYILDSANIDHYPLMSPFNTSTVSRPFPDWLSPPSVNLISPQNTTYPIGNLTIAFLVDKQVLGYSYSLDGQVAVIYGNTSLSGLPSGQHNITIYATDNFGNLAASETTNFTIEHPLEFSVGALFVIPVVVLVSVVLLYLFLRRRSAQ